MNSGDTTVSLWGYCGVCERWRFSDRWSTQQPSVCSECGNPPDLLETIDGDRIVLRLDLEVAVGPVGNRHFLT